MNRRARFLLGAAAIAAVALGAWLSSPDGTLRWLAGLSSDPVRFGAVLLALSLVRPFLAWPTTLLAVGAGYGYGAAGIGVALALMVVTSLVPYSLARRTGGGGRLSDAGERFVDDAGTVRSVAASRLLPAPSDVVSVGAGAANVPLRPFLVGTALGELPWAAGGALAGASLDALTADSLSSAIDVRLVAAAALLAALLLAGPAYRFLRGDDSRLGRVFGRGWR
ncbi:VTT domain-containing protein [Halegenticoccus soli]|uniref:VTT domain-containing protein n=1 Tax=Halegenticoccus soli TaxID=1985678 RepID=UPI000C6EACA6|nr:VTT domain-containing protein [Halegenticoccus soli]